MNFYQTMQTKWSSRKNIFFIGAAVTILCTSATTIINAVNFAGDWKLNESKSEMGQFGGRGAAKSIKVVSSDANSITLERTSTNQNGENVVRKETLSLDGKEVESAGGFGNSKRKSSAKWSADGQSLVITSVTSFERDGQTMEFKGKETWKLGDNGQTLAIETVSTFQGGDNTTKLVYEKAK